MILFMRKIIIILVAFMLSGCHMMEKMYKSESTPPEPIPDIIVLHGVTLADYQITQVRCYNSDVLVKILDKEETRWRVLNEFEVEISTVGSGGGAVWFKNKCYPTYDQGGRLIRLVFTGKPVAPTGTQYEIQSYLRTGSSIRKLY